MWFSCNMPEFNSQHTRPLCLLLPDPFFAHSDCNSCCDTRCPGSNTRSSRVELWTPEPSQEGFAPSALSPEGPCAHTCEVDAIDLVASQHHRLCVTRPEATNAIPVQAHQAGKDGGVVSTNQAVSCQNRTREDHVTTSKHTGADNQTSQLAPRRKYTLLISRPEAWEHPIAPWLLATH